MKPTASLWGPVPFARPLAALTAGIVLQWQMQLSSFLLTTLLFLLAGFLLFSFLLSYRLRFRLQLLFGILLHVFFLVMGARLVWQHDVRHNPTWVGLTDKAKAYALRLEEPLVVKPNSYKALARVQAVGHGGTWQTAGGGVIVYFKKDSTLPRLSYGDVIVTGKPLQAIRNSGNPGGFDYQRYCLFQGITHQVFLQGKDFVHTGKRSTQPLPQFLFACRKWVVATLQRFIVAPKERGLAEALLIGYKDDLDKTLVQAYSNTGVVHVIAISGLHLGLIYWLLLLLTAPLRRRKESSVLALFIVLTGMWIFSLLAGAQPSVLRSAVMFSCLALGVFLGKQTAMLNTLALSAFLLLAYNPYWLWDVGFQLSYAAVLSILLFYRPVYHWFVIRNRSLDFVWKLNAVTLSAQVLTLPLSIYHFHQFPVLFLLTNLVAVPLSSVVLLGEILLCALAPFPTMARLLGDGLQSLMAVMNRYIERLDSVSFSVWNGLWIDGWQWALCTVGLLCFCFWWLHQNKALLWAATGCAVLFAALRTASFVAARQQQTLVVYQVPRYQAIDLFSGRQCAFIGDAALWQDAFARNFHLRPSRTLHRVAAYNRQFEKQKSFAWAGRQVTIVDTALMPATAPPKPVDLLILSRNPKLYVNQLLQHYTPRQVVLDASVPPWKAALWQQDCAAASLPCFNVGTQGAFVWRLAPQ